MPLAATCATLAALILSAPAGETVNLTKSKCERITLKRTLPGSVTVNAGGSTIAGLTITASGIRWRSGTIVAPKGFDGKAGDGYGLLIRGGPKAAATNVRIEGVRFGASRKAVVLDTASNVSLSGNRFDGYGEDGIIANKVDGLNVTRNRFLNVRGLPTQCTVAGGVLPGLSSRACIAQGGTWADGWHPDAVQLRNGIKRAVITFNVINANSQGIAQMDTTGDAPLEDVLVANNEVRAGGHHISLGGKGCINCRIKNNVVRRFDPNGYKAVIRPGPALRCGNDVQDEKPDGVCQ